MSETGTACEGVTRSVPASGGSQACVHVFVCVVVYIHVVCVVVYIHVQCCRVLSLRQAHSG